MAFSSLESNLGIKGGVMRRSVLFCAVVVVLGLLAVAGVARPQEKLPRTISIGTHPIGAFFHTTGVAAAKAITDHTSMKGIVKPMSGPVAWLPYMERGDLELGVLNVWDAEKAYLGESMYEKLSNKKGFSIYLLSTTVPNAIGFIVAKDSGIKTVADLKGKRVAGNYPTPSCNYRPRRPSPTPISRGRT
jgi:TRAP transporter TAXI family solute receptor